MAARVFTRYSVRAEPQTDGRNRVWATHRGTGADEIVTYLATPEENPDTTESERKAVLNQREAQADADAQALAAENQRRAAQDAAIAMLLATDGSPDQVAKAASALIRVLKG